MEASFEFEAEIRPKAGTGVARRLRREKKIPAVLYGAGEAPVMLSLAQSQVDKNLKQEAVFSHILTLNLPGSGGVQAVLKEVHRHPSKELVIHMDFQRVKADEEVRVHVPLHFLGEQTSVGVKKGGVVLHNLTEVEVTCLPHLLPEYIEADLTNLDLGETLHLGDLVIAEGVHIVELAHEGGAAVPVVTIQPPTTAAPEAAEAGEEGEEEG